MKKLLLLFLTLVGMTTTASADWYVTGGAEIVNGTGWTGTATAANKMTLTATENVYVLAVANKTVTGSTDYYFKITDGTNEYPSSAYDGSYKINFTYGATYTIVYYFNSSTHDIRVIATPLMRCSLGNSGSGNWSYLYDADFMFTRDGDFTWTYEISSANFTKDNEFRIYSSLFGKQAYPNATAKTVSYGGSSVSSEYFNGDDTSWSWKISKPAYSYNKVKITATYKPFDTTNGADFGQWDVKADAYISKTANGTNAGASLGYSTFGAETDVDLSSLPSGVTAETATVDAYGKITYNSATELAAGEGVLLTNTTGANVALSIPVKASAEAVAGNALRRVADEELEQGDATYWHYILTKNTVPNENADLGWYLVNEEGCNNLTIGTAYLQVSKITPSRGFYPLWSEDVTAIEKLTPAQSEGVVYDLQGRKVAQPTKGLYIVNGKKVIMK